MVGMAPLLKKIVDWGPPKVILRKQRVAATWSPNEHTHCDVQAAFHLAI